VAPSMLPSTDRFVSRIHVTSPFWLVFLEPAARLPSVVIKGQLGSPLWRHSRITPCFCVAIFASSFSRTTQVFDAGGSLEIPLCVVATQSFRIDRVDRTLAPAYDDPLSRSLHV
jgi:hypothetical protein